uniref:Malate/L-lactate dehydrogenase n=1 Tax=uncultured bacterium contig00086 TaxID=1181559 RepID=A0A806KGA7_9BACT|nr:malate/L-lactate dehydrogenase [uncultured bacterium contig00086]
MLHIPREKLEKLCSDIFEALGLPADEARDSAEILAAADARGIRSHGTARIKRYADGLKAGLIKGGIKPRVIHETPISLVLAADGAMGLSISKKAMADVIAKAKKSGVGVCSIRDSNHFGIAGYYSEMAAREDMIGIAMTNTAALGVPTFAREAAFGTNPIAFAVPALGGKLFSLDMATTTVTRGKVEVYERERKQFPPGWAVGTNGLVTTDPVSLLEDMLYQRGGGLLPLGGEGELQSGYKGYGLGVLVDILCAVASGGTFGRAVKDSEITSARVCHFFMAIRLDLFRPAEDFKRDMAAMLDDLNSLKAAEGASRVYYAGQKEHEAEEQSRLHGIPLEEGVWETLCNIAGELNVPIPETSL